jgi:hypothetical protein
MACKRSSVQVRYPPLPKRRSRNGLRRFLLTQICITFRANSICITFPNFGSDTTCGLERAFLEPPTPKIRFEREKQWRTTRHTGKGC